jgi:nicotinamidase-related amidase
MDIDPRSTAVLGIHWQIDIVTKEGAFGAFFGEMVEKTGVIGRAADLFDAARSAGVPVFYTRVCFQEGHPDLIQNSALFDLVAQTKCLVDGSPGAAIVPELAPRDGDVVIDHVRVSGTYRTDLVEQLKGRGVKSVFVCGVSTNASVEATARDLTDAGFDVYLVADCSTTASEEAHAASVQTLGLLLRGIITATEARSALGSGATV